MYFCDMTDIKTKKEFYTFLLSEIERKKKEIQKTNSKNLKEFKEKKTQGIISKDSVFQNQVAFPMGEISLSSYWNIRKFVEDKDPEIPLFSEVKIKKVCAEMGIPFKEIMFKLEE